MINIEYNSLCPFCYNKLLDAGKPQLDFINVVEEKYFICLKCPNINKFTILWLAYSNNKLSHIKYEFRQEIVIAIDIDLNKINYLSFKPDFDGICKSYDFNMVDFNSISDLINNINTLVLFS